MTYEPLNRRLSILVAVFTFLGVALGVIALATNYWSVRTVIREVNNGTINVQQPVEEWNVCSLFSQCFLYAYFCLFRVFSIHVKLVFHALQTSLQ